MPTRKRWCSFAATERINKGGGYGRGYHGTRHIKNINAGKSRMVLTKRVLAERVMARKVLSESYNAWVRR